MSHPQTSPRGTLAKKRIEIGSQVLTYNSSGLVLSEGIKISNARLIEANTTGFILEAESAIPTARSNAKLTVVSNTTGNTLAVNTTGTTWKYLNVTSVQPT